MVEVGRYFEMQGREGQGRTNLARAVVAASVCCWCLQVQAIANILVLLL